MDRQNGYRFHDIAEYQRGRLVRPARPPADRYRAVPNPDGQVADRYRLIRGKVHSTGADGYLASWFASRSRSGLLASFLHALTLGIALTTLFWSAFFGALVLLMDDLPKGGAVLMAGIFATFFACGWLALSSTFPPPDRRPCRRSPSHPRERSHEL